MHKSISSRVDLETLEGEFGLMSLVWYQVVVCQQMEKEDYLRNGCDVSSLNHDVERVCVARFLQVWSCDDCLVMGFSHSHGYQFLT